VFDWRSSAQMSPSTLSHSVYVLDWLEENVNRGVAKSVNPKRVSWERQERDGYCRGVASRVYEMLFPALWV